jgi:antitoxin component of RelBE/YafQ-DinJ toxin-antitoxin module
MQKIHVNYRLEKNEKTLVELLAKHFGTSETDVIRMLVKKAAADVGIVYPITTVEWQVLDGVLERFDLDPRLMKELEDLKKEVPARREPLDAKATDAPRG